MELSEEQLLKASLPMLFTPFGMSIDSKLEHSLKIPSLRLVTLLDSLTIFRLEQPLKAFMPISVTLSGIKILARFVQLANAATPIWVTLAGISISEMGHCPKAQSPMDVIFFGISMDVSLVHP